MTVPGKRWIPEKDSKWVRLVKVWKEEELITRVLAERFGLRKQLIQFRLTEQFGTYSAKVYHSRLE